MVRKVLIALIVVWFGATLAQLSYGKEYPERPVEIQTAYTAGGAIDLAIRAFADIASRYLGQPMLVVDKPGAGGSIVAADVISSAPDGYKLATLSNFFFAVTTKTQKLSFDPSNLVPLANVVELKVGLVVRGDSPWKTLNELLDYGKKNPGKLRWGHPGRGLTNHMGGLLIFKKSGVEAIDIPYKGTPEMITALLGGHLDALSSPYGGLKDHVKAGKARYLIFYTDHPYADPPGVPCAPDVGFPEVGQLKTLIGIYAHKATPEKVKKTLMDAFGKTFETPELKKRIDNIGDEPRFGSPEFIVEAIKKGEEVGVPIIKELGLFYKGRN